METLGSSLIMSKNLPGHRGRTTGRCNFLIVCRAPPIEDAVNRDCGELNLYIYMRQEEDALVVGWQSEWSRSESDRSTTDHGKQTWSSIY